MSSVVDTHMVDTHMVDTHMVDTLTQHKSIFCFRTHRRCTSSDTPPHYMTGSGASSLILSPL